MPRIQAVADLCRTLRNRTDHSGRWTAMTVSDVAGLSGHGIRCFLIRSAKSAASSAFENIARAEVSLPPPFPL